MATTTRKRTTTPKVDAPKVEAVKAENAKPVREVAPKTNSKKVFNADDGIICRSVTQGGLFMEGPKTHMHYEWVQYGDITEVEYSDLAALVRVKSTYVFGPWFMIDDEDFIEEFPQLKKFYTENYTLSDLETILSYPTDRMMDEVKALPKTAAESLKVMSASAISDGTLDSVAKIKALDDFFGTNLSLLAEFKN